MHSPAESGSDSDIPKMENMAATLGTAAQGKDDALTVCAISLVAAIVGNVVHEALGHAATALLTGTRSGVLTTVAWSSIFDSRLVAAGGTLANLAAAVLFWSVLRAAKGAPVRWRFFLLTSLAFNILDGTGYFLFSGFTDFGDWALVIARLQPHWLWRTVLVVVGVASYYGAVLLLGAALVRYVGVLRGDLPRLRKLTLIPYFSAIVIVSAAGLLNPLGMHLMWQSALPATAGGHSGLLWLMYAIPRGAVPQRPSDAIARNYGWMAAALAVSVFFIFVLGRGITLHR
jgi:hypothetical protein